MKKIQQISDCELKIMKIIWENGNSILFAQIMHILSKKDNTSKSNTILTFLARLIDKKCITTVKHGRINEYIALISK